MTARVAIVGAGVCGLSTAWHLLDLAPEQVEITVFDMAHPGSGTSGLAVGMVETQFSNADAVETRAYGRAFFDMLCRDGGPTFTRSGYLRLARSEEDVESFRRSIMLQAGFGIDDAELLDRRQLQEEWPDLVLDAGVIGGLVGRSDGYVDSFEICSTLASDLRSRGVRILSSAELTGAQRNGSTWQLTTTGPGVEADVVVNAAGPWAGAVGDLLGAPVTISNQEYGVVAATLIAPPVRPLPFVMDYIPGSGVPGLYFRQEGSGQLIAGLHSEDGVFAEVEPSLSARSLDVEQVALIAELLSERVRRADEATVSTTWTGVCAMTPDGHPVVGVHPEEPTVINAVGAGASGIQLAPAIGRHAAQSLLGLAPSLRPAHPWNTPASHPVSSRSSA